jgi:hypothetical protein
MVVNRLSQSAIRGLLLALLSSMGIAQANRSSYDPATEQGPSKPRDGFVGYTMKRINPADTDYGSRLAEGRAILLDETIRNGYFWSNVVALGLLGCLFIIIIYQRQVQARRESSAAAMLAQYEHELARSHAKVNEVSSQNTGFLESFNRLKELALRSQSPPANPPDEAESRPPRSHTASTQVKPTAEPKNGAGKPLANRSAAVVAEPASQIGLFKTEVELMAKVNTLNQQLAHAEDEKKELRRQLNETGRRLQAEQEKNRSLKGE